LEIVPLHEPSPNQATGFSPTPHPNPLPTGEGAAYHPQLPAGARPSEPSNPIPLNPWPNPPKPSVRFLPRPPGEGRSRSSSLIGHGPNACPFLGNRPSPGTVAESSHGVFTNPSPQPSPDGRGSRVSPATPRWSPTVRAVKSHSSEPLAQPSETLGALSPSPSGRGPG